MQVYVLSATQCTMLQQFFLWHLIGIRLSCIASYKCELDVVMLAKRLDRIKSQAGLVVKLQEHLSDMRLPLAYV